MITPFRAIPESLREWLIWIAQIEQQGNFEAELTGYASNPTGTVEWVKIGRRITVHAPAAISGTSNATSFTMTGLPEKITPSVDKRCVTELTDNGTSVAALAVISGTTITFHTDAPFSATGWTGSGTKAVPQGWQCSWLLEV